MRRKSGKTARPSGNNVGAERRSPRRRVAELDAGLNPELAGALVAGGWTVCPRLPDGDGDAGLHVVGPGDRLVASDRAPGDGGCLAVLASGNEPELSHAASRTPFVYDKSLPAPTLVELLERAAQLHGHSLRGGPRHRSVLVVDIGVSVELDGVHVPLGIAARNLLFLLAARDGEILAKDAWVEAGARKVRARQCRRDLGQELGPPLARLLIPEIRGAPYRLRTSRELEQMNAGTVLRIKGRSSVRTTYRSDMDHF